jgi:hypothetical protein
VKFALGEDIGTRPLLLIAVMLFMGSVQAITTGILAEFMARSNTGAQHYAVREIFGADKA